jgi:hypothetical protein
MWAPQTFFSSLALGKRSLFLIPSPQGGKIRPRYFVNNANAPFQSSGGGLFR